jgi:uncharacterized protein (DUF1778 family)
MTDKGKKEERIELRLPAEARQQIEQAAALQGRTVPDFVLAAALQQAARVMEQQRLIHLTGDESASLADLMTAESQPNEKAIAAIQHYRETMGS